MSSTGVEQFVGPEGGLDEWFVIEGDNLQRVFVVAVGRAGANISHASLGLAFCGGVISLHKARVFVAAQIVGKLDISLEVAIYVGAPVNPWEATYGHAVPVDEKNGECAPWLMP